MTGQREIHYLNTLMKIARFFYIILASLLLCAPFAHAEKAESMEAVKRNLIKRQPAINKMWKEGLVGENNQGYLIARDTLNPKQQAMLKSENNDRLKVYRSIARHSNRDPQVVGQLRAQSIAQRAAKGLWLQDSKGKWYQKSGDRS